ncbi:DUF72 domain-containing protein [Pedobacter sp. SL55]|uniref:DUF72 domain-containing protein n=1 Tax=Pedobacter sp. SL55 TaxID=2995161 RepID=UPI00226E10D4|nr:DUF72 domain-containing protein [Pedobacter sp. SL55]WAC40279.1 DUF72 domain-containing protein [Pedobacter sp. SL55]
MEFGRVETNEINEVDFTLPPDGTQTLLTLTGNRIEEPKFFVGCAKWGRKEWLNLIYPPKTKEKDFLGEYVRHFNSIELNAVFYGIPKEEQILKWKEMADKREDFLFCPKFSRAITHIKRLNNAQAETDLYLKAISAFGDKLGPCFLQLGDNFGPKNLPVLQQYLEALPRDFNLFLEVRHADWFANPKDRKSLFSLLADLKIGAAITDASGRRDCVHMELPTPKAFIRFVGNGGKFLDNSDKKRVDDWIERLDVWLDKGLEEIYFFLHQHDESDTPIIADYTIEKFKEKLGSKLPRIHFLEQQGGLFG